MTTPYKSLRALIAGFVINLSIGVLYGWGIFVVPLEELLNISRSTISIVPATGLLLFTVGVYVHDILVNRLHPSALAFGVMMVAGAGHLIFYLYPSYFTLLAGYGVLFGLSAGISYGFALMLARRVSLISQGLAIGSTVAAFAIGGMIVSLLASFFDVSQHTVNVFGFGSILYFIIAIFTWALLRNYVLNSETPAEKSGASDIIKTPQFWKLAFVYFCMSYTGLMIVSHGAAVMLEREAPASIVSLTPFALNFGYMLGAIIGGVLIARSPTPAIPFLFMSLSALSLSALVTTLPVPVWLLAVFCIGLQFGSTVSIFVVLLVKTYGELNAGHLFGRINIGYGTAGFLAPVVTANLYDYGDNYSLPIWGAILLSIMCILTITSLARSKS